MRVGENYQNNMREYLSERIKIGDIIDCSIKMDIFVVCYVDQDILDSQRQNHNIKKYN